VSYGKERDYEADGHRIEHSTLDRVGAGDRNLTKGESSQRSLVGINARTTGAWDGGAKGRNA